ncbi:DUF6286 domain-containing protein [Streptomyces geranii]|uniref:DUF6286 domain-containing protein n=1 Tax=Streptomyces geranii TaxID=2058923 RepID=UPI0018E54DA7|nr:DUF6286 domain-containing protein [Streptomyces geranii]
MTAAGQRGTTTVSERAVRRIAERAAVEALPGPGGGRAPEASVSVRGSRAEVSLGVTLPYPAPLAETVSGLQKYVTGRTSRLTGLDVPYTRIGVTGLTPSASPGAIPAPATGASSGSPAQEAAQGAGKGRTPRRSWSRRRVPAGLLAALAAAGCGALAVDLVRVHTWHRAPEAWRVSAVDWLSGHGPGDPEVVIMGGLMVLAGLWTLLLAVTPGRRGRSTVHTPAARVHATVDRSAVEGLVRDTVGRTDGIGTVRVRARSRRITVRAGLVHGDRADAAAAATTAARDALTACHLRRTPRVRVTVAPEPGWQPLVRDKGVTPDTDAKTNTDTNTNTGTNTDTKVNVDPAEPARIPAPDSLVGGDA